MTCTGCDNRACRMTDDEHRLVIAKALAAYFVGRPEKNWRFYTGAALRVFEELKRATISTPATNERA